MTGDASCYGTIGNAITLAGDFEIEFDWKRVDSAGTSGSAILGSEAAGNYFYLSDTANTTPDAVLLYASSEFDNITGVTTAVAQNQHCHIKVTRTSGTLAAFVDGVAAGTPTGTNTGALALDRVGRNANGTQFDNSSISNLKIANTVTNLALRSQAFNTSPWFVSSGFTVTENAATAPDGTTTAVSIDTGDIANYSGVSQAAIAVDMSGGAVFSYYWKKQDYDFEGALLTLSGGTA